MTTTIERLRKSPTPYVQDAMAFPERLEQWRTQHPSIVPGRGHTCLRKLWMTRHVCNTMSCYQYFGPVGDFSHLLDHVEMWRNTDSGLMELTSHPYGPSPSIEEDIIRLQKRAIDRVGVARQQPKMCVCGHSRRMHEWVDNYNVQPYCALCGTRCPKVPPPPSVYELSIDALGVDAGWYGHRTTPYHVHLTPVAEGVS